MTHIRDLLTAGPTFSFEFFPPKTDEAQRQLEKALRELEPLAPSFVSVTYGAGGTTRDRTHGIVVGINDDTSMTAMAHLTCACHSAAELEEIVSRYRDAGVVNLLALGGDPPSDLADPPPTELPYAIELVELARGVGDFSIGVAAHPEGHPRSPDMESDRRHLADKLRVADFGITQFFFNNDVYFRMVDELDALGVDAPVVPGIMPVTNPAQIERFAQLAGAEFPRTLAERIEALGDDVDAVRRLGIEVATEMCAELLEHGVPGLHFYTLNRSTATREIYANLGLGPTE
ncbi:MAG TPA: methylenetetrahydrofolate reductase [NAD(P)H] [Acidimicrobiia bacterium]|nr:methylenetetrahydrofolate reductase [NAD(P)H] [Acidimicrobiia bacterium]